MSNTVAPGTILADKYRLKGAGVTVEVDVSDLEVEQVSPRGTGGNAGPSGFGPHAQRARR
jgi:hypothetical protein